MRLDAMLAELVADYPDLAPVVPRVEEAFAQLLGLYQRGGTLLVCGNGGSAADSEHIVGELVKSCALPRPVPRGLHDQLAAMDPDDASWVDRLQQGLPAVALVAHSAVMTAIANDQAAELMFAQQVMAYGRPGDVLWGISTSGNAASVVRALQVAKARGLVTIGLTGPGGGRMARWCDTLMAVPGASTPKIQERHLPIYHTLCLMVERELFAS